MLDLSVLLVLEADPSLCGWVHEGLHQCVGCADAILVDVEIYAVVGCYLINILSIAAFSVKVTSTIKYWLSCNLWIFSHVSSVVNLHIMW